MQKQILSEAITIDKPENLTARDIECTLRDNVGEVLRWAIIDADMKKLKICVTYER